MPPRHTLVFLFILTFLGACGSSDRGPAAIGRAFVGPATLNLRDELAPGSKVVATMKHGEQLDILQTRRRFVQVRTSTGAMGWTDSRLLMTPQQMEELKALAEKSASLPSQGAATVFELLNVHTEASRPSPSFAQITEDMVVDVVGHRVTPRTSTAPRQQLVEKKAAPPPKRKKKQAGDTRRVAKPPMPTAPAPPPDWLELSHREPPPPDPAVPPPPPPKPVPMDEWALVRLKDGRAGWALFRMLHLAIPDEVAQYAEGHRITSYFALQDIPDGDAMKHAWLWTTNSQRAVTYQFDGLRVFTWNVRRHRYETVYRERGLTGYYPVEVNRQPVEAGAIATFSVIVQDGDQFVKKTYAYNGYRVSLLRKDVHGAPNRELGDPGEEETPEGAGPGASEPWYSRIGARIRSLWN
jgi:hypothetical protein